MSGHWSRFAESSRSTSSTSCGHRELSLANDDEPSLTCRACGKRWTFVPDGIEPAYAHDDDPTFPNMLDDRGWPKGVRVVMRGVRRARR